MFANNNRLMFEAQVLMQRKARYYNQIKPPSGLGGRSPAPQTIVRAAAKTTIFLNQSELLFRGRLMPRIKTNSGGLQRIP